MSNMVQVFTLPKDEMVTQGDFFAAMFVALAGAALISYYIMGWGTNTLAQVSSASCMKIADQESLPNRLQTLAHSLRRGIFNEILRQDLEYFDRPENNIGALTSRIDSHPQAVFELMGFNIGFILIASFNVAACSILGIVYAWKLGLVIVFAGFPFVVGCGWVKMTFDGRLDRIIAKRLATSSAIASESTTAIRTVSSLGIESAILERYTHELDQAISKSVKPLLNVMVWFGLQQGSEYWFQALGFWWGGLRDERREGSREYGSRCCDSQPPNQ